MNIYTSRKISVLYASRNVWLFTYNVVYMYSARQLEVTAMVYVASLSNHGQTKHDHTAKIASERRDVALRAIAILWTEHKRCNLLHMEFRLAWLKFKLSCLFQTFRGIQVIYYMLSALEADQMYEVVSSFRCDISVFVFGQILHFITSLYCVTVSWTDKQTLVLSLTPSNKCTDK